MKPLVAAILIAGIALFYTPKTVAQSNNYPNIEKDFLNGERYHARIKHKLAIPGVWGLGYMAEYKIDNLLYVSAEAGYGWIIGTHEADFDKKFRGWFNLQAGYPVLDFVSKSKGRWVIDRTEVADGTYEKYYKITVPTHNTLLALVGYAMEPGNTKIYPEAGGPVVPYSFQAPVYTVGVKWLRHSKTRVRVNTRSGSTQRRFEIYTGLVIPAKSEVVTPSNYRNLPKFNRLGYELLFTFPYRLNGWATFDMGIRSFGYSNQEDMAQFVIGNTFYLR